MQNENLQEVSDLLLRCVADGGQLLCLISRYKDRGTIIGAVKGVSGVERRS